MSSSLLLLLERLRNASLRSDLRNVLLDLKVYTTQSDAETSRPIAQALFTALRTSSSSSAQYGSSRGELDISFAILDCMLDLVGAQRAARETSEAAASRIRVSAAILVPPLPLGLSSSSSSSEGQSGGTSSSVSAQSSSSSSSAPTNGIMPLLLRFLSPPQEGADDTESSISLRVATMDLLRALFAAAPESTSSTIFLCRGGAIALVKLLDDPIPDIRRDCISLLSAAARQDFAFCGVLAYHDGFLKLVKLLDASLGSVHPRAVEWVDALESRAPQFFHHRATVDNGRRRRKRRRGRAQECGSYGDAEEVEEEEEDGEDEGAEAAGKWEEDEEEKHQRVSILPPDSLATVCDILSVIQHSLSTSNGVGKGQSGVRVSLVESAFLLRCPALLALPLRLQALASLPVSSASPTSLKDIMSDAEEWALLKRETARVALTTVHLLSSFFSFPNVNSSSGSGSNSNSSSNSVGSDSNNLIQQPLSSSSWLHLVDLELQALASGRLTEKKEKQQRGAGPSAFTAASIPSAAVEERRMTQQQSLAALNALQNHAMPVQSLLGSTKNLLQALSALAIFDDANDDNAHPGYGSTLAPLPRSPLNASEAVSFLLAGMLYQHTKNQLLLQEVMIAVPAYLSKQATAAAATAAAISGQASASSSSSSSALSLGSLGSEGPNAAASKLLASSGGPSVAAAFPTPSVPFPAAQSATASRTSASTTDCKTASGIHVAHALTSLLTRSWSAKRETERDSALRVVLACVHGGMNGEVSAKLAFIGHAVAPPPLLLESMLKARECLFACACDETLLRSEQDSSDPFSSSSLDEEYLQPPPASLVAWNVLCAGVSAHAAQLWRDEAYAASLSFSTDVAIRALDAVSCILCACLGGPHSDLSSSSSLSTTIQGSANATPTHSAAHDTTVQQYAARLPASRLGLPLPLGTPKDIAVGAFLMDRFCELISMGPFTETPPSQSALTGGTPPSAVAAASAPVSLLQPEAVQVLHIARLLLALVRESEASVSSLLADPSHLTLFDASVRAPSASSSSSSSAAHDCSSVVIQGCASALISSLFAYSPSSQQQEAAGKGSKSSIGRLSRADLLEIVQRREGGISNLLRALRAFLDLPLLVRASRGGVSTAQFCSFAQADLSSLYTMSPAAARSFHVCLPLLEANVMGAYLSGNANRGGQSSASDASSSRTSLSSSASQEFPEASRGQDLHELCLSQSAELQQLRREVDLLRRSHPGAVDVMEASLENEAALATIAALKENVAANEREKVLLFEKWGEEQKALREDSLRLGEAYHQLDAAYKDVSARALAAEEALNHQRPQVQQDGQASQAIEQQLQQERQQHQAAFDELRGITMQWQGHSQHLDSKVSYLVDNINKLFRLIGSQFSLQQMSPESFSSIPFVEAHGTLEASDHCFAFHTSAINRLAANVQGATTNSTSESRAMFVASEERKAAMAKRLKDFEEQFATVTLQAAQLPILTNELDRLQASSNSAKYRALKAEEAGVIESELFHQRMREVVQTAAEEREDLLLFQALHEKQISLLEATLSSLGAQAQVDRIRDFTYAALNELAGSSSVDTGARAIPEFVEGLNTVAPKSMSSVSVFSVEQIPASFPPSPSSTVNNPMGLLDLGVAKDTSYENTNEGTVSNPSVSAAETSGRGPPSTIFCRPPISKVVSTQQRAKYVTSGSGVFSSESVVSGSPSSDHSSVHAAIESSSSDSNAFIAGKAADSASFFQSSSVSPFSALPETGSQLQEGQREDAAIDASTAGFGAQSNDRGPSLTSTLFSGVASFFSRSSNASEDVGGGSDKPAFSPVIPEAGSSGFAEAGSSDVAEAGSVTMAAISLSSFSASSVFPTVSNSSAFQEMSLSDNSFEEIDLGGGGGNSSISGNSASSSSSSVAPLKAALVASSDAAASPASASAGGSADYADSFVDASAPRSNDHHEGGGGGMPSSSSQSNLAATLFKALSQVSAAARHLADRDDDPASRSLSGQQFFDSTNQPPSAHPSSPPLSMEDDVDGEEKGRPGSGLFTGIVSIATSFFSQASSTSDAEGYSSPISSALHENFKAYEPQGEGGGRPEREGGAMSMVMLSSEGSDDDAALTASDTTSRAEALLSSPEMYFAASGVESDFDQQVGLTKTTASPTEYSSSQSILASVVPPLDFSSSAAVSVASREEEVPSQLPTPQQVSFSSWSSLRDHAQASSTHAILTPATNATPSFAPATSSYSTTDHSLSATQHPPAVSFSNTLSSAASSSGFSSTSFFSSSPSIPTPPSTSMFLGGQAEGGGDAVDFFNSMTTVGAGQAKEDAVREYKDEDLLPSLITEVRSPTTLKKWF